jgi:hypothetical protein
MRCEDCFLGLHDDYDGGIIQVWESVDYILKYDIDEKFNFCPNCGNKNSFEE